MRVFRSLSQRELYSRDQGEVPGFLRRLFTRLPSEVVQPNTPAEAAEAVRSAYRNGTPIVPRGAGSTAFGQVLPVVGGLVLDLSFLKGIRPVEAGAASVTVEAGARWADVSAYLAERGLALGSYPSSWYSTVGGWIATGGLGINSLAFGPLKDQVLELTVCAAEGPRALRPGDPLFDAFFETEGQMGVVLSATLKVRPLLPTSFPFLVPCAGVEEAWTLYREAASSGLGLLHASLYSPVRMRHFNHTLAHRMEHKRSEIKGPFEEKWSVLACLEDPAEARRFAAWLKERGARPAPAFHGTYAWQERFYPLKGKRDDQMFLGNEVRLESARGAAYSKDLERLSEMERLDLAIEVNAASKDDSLVIASFFAPFKDPARYLERLALVFKLDDLGCAVHGGRLYHIGVYNTPFLGRKFGPERLARLAEAKRGLDPRRLFNPGKFFELKTAFTSGLPGALNRLGAALAMPLLRAPRLAGPLFAALGRILGAEPLPSEEVRADALFKTFRECVSCGFCIPVCPAYLVTQDERTTARGKLFLAQRWLRGGELGAEETALLHSCMHCGACTKVCQNALDLVPAWRELEDRVARQKGRPEGAIREFVKTVESSPDYHRLLRRGFIAEPKIAEKA